MEYYRIYLLTDHDHIDNAHDAHYVSDGEALRGAAGLIGSHPALEIWCGPRRVGRFTANDLHRRWDSLLASEASGC
jgi:hypothetical protein